MSSLRARLFVALALAALFGALATGLYAVYADPSTLGAAARLVRVAPKALVLSALLLPASALGAAFVGRRLARPIEELTEAATRIAEGERSTHLPRGGGDEMRRLARALVSMRRELEGRPYAAAFLRDAWHDLKTPVAGLRATLEVLDDEALEDPVATRRFVENLRRSTERLERTLGDLITLARFETASLGVERPHSVETLVRDALERVSPLAEATDVNLHTHIHADAVRCDASALGRALANVIENAVSASPRGDVEISAFVAPSGVVLDVSNAPASVPDDARQRLFQRAPTSRDGRGSGLGLAMARAAVEAHGGSLRFLELGPPRVRVRLELPR